MTEELKDPFRNLPYAIYLSLPVVTFLYILANVAYLAVLTPTEMMASNAIAVVRIFLVIYALSFYVSKIILVEYQSFWMGPICFGRVQIILGRSKL